MIPLENACQYLCIPETSGGAENPKTFSCPYLHHRITPKACEGCTLHFKVNLDIEVKMIRKLIAQYKWCFYDEAIKKVSLSDIFCLLEY